MAIPSATLLSVRMPRARPAQYELAAIPIEYGRTGSRSFFRDVLGVLHGADRRGAVGSVTDPKVD